MRWRPSPEALRLALPVMALAALLVSVFVMRPNVMGYNGLHLLFKLGIPIALATLAQMVIMSVNDLDLSMGSFVSFVACVTATWLVDAPLIGALMLAGAIAVYAALGMVIAARGLPSIVVTLGMSFVWAGLAVLVLPTPGGTAPGWVAAVMGARPALMPVGIAGSILIAVLAHLLIMRSSFGVLIRGVGGNERSVSRAGWSVLLARGAAYATAATFAVASGITLVGLMTSADANIALRYTLLSIAGVILGGGEFTGGRVSAIGAVVGALTLLLAGSFLTFLNVPPDWQIGAQGMILILILALRLLLVRLERRGARA
ncbi:MAG: ABC transporter permease [Rhodobacterales bacterium]|nr:ABC transporter permease [Rhodobacterales bacterium]